MSEKDKKRRRKRAIEELYNAEMLCNETRQELEGVNTLDGEFIRKQLNIIRIHLDRVDNAHTIYNQMYKE